MKTIKNIMLFVLAMLTMAALFCESESVGALLAVKAVGFGLLWLTVKVANTNLAKS